MSLNKNVPTFVQSIDAINYPLACHHFLAIFTGCSSVAGRQETHSSTELNHVKISSSILAAIFCSLFSFDRLQLKDKEC